MGETDSAKDGEGKRILVCGDRHWTDGDLIHKRLSKFPKGTVMFHGAAPGADSIAAKIGQRLGFIVMSFPAQWTIYGKAAGPIRNTQMLDGNPSIVIAFHDDIENSKGTADTAKKAFCRGIMVEIVSHAGTEIWK